MRRVRGAATLLWFAMLFIATAIRKPCAAMGGPEAATAGSVDLALTLQQRCHSTHGSGSSTRGDGHDSSPRKPASGDCCAGVFTCCGVPLQLSPPSLTVVAACALASGRRIVTQRSAIGARYRRAGLHFATAPPTR